MIQHQTYTEGGEVRGRLQWISVSEQGRDAGGGYALAALIQPCCAEVQRHLPGADAEHQTPCVPPHLLLQHGESRDESKDASVSYGAFRHRCDHEHLYTPWLGGGQRRDDSHGRTECCQEGTGKDHRREACDPENVSGGLTIKNEKGALRM